MNPPKMQMPSWVLWRETGVKYYLGVAGGGLGLVFLVLNQRGVPYISCLLPLLVGAAGAALGWARTPIVYLIVLGTVLSIEPNRYFMSPRGGNVWLTDVMLCAGVLAFVAAQYRLQALLKSVFPPALSTGKTATATLAHGPVTMEPRSRVAHGVAARAGHAAFVAARLGVIAHFIAALLPTTFGNPDFLPWRSGAMTLLWLLWRGGIGAGRHLRLLSSSAHDWDRGDALPARRAAGAKPAANSRHDRWRAWGRLWFPARLADQLIDLITLLWLATLIVGLVALGLWVYVSISG